MITIDAQEKAGEIVFSVADQGIGVPGEIQETIFEMFYRGQHGGKRSRRDEMRWRWSSSAIRIGAPLSTRLRRSAAVRL